MTMPSKDTMLLNSPQERMRFREEHYDIAYAYAFDATGSDKQARELVERMFAVVERSHANSPIAVHCDSYLAAQINLLYARSSLPSLSKEGMSKATFSEAPSFPRESSAALSFSGTADSLSTAGASVSMAADSLGKVPDYAAEAARRPEAVPSAVPKEPRPASPAPAAPIAGRQGSPLDKPENVLPVSNKFFSEAVYDEADTVFWTPDSESRRDPVEAIAPEPVWTQEEKTVHHSAFLRVLNGVLILCSLASIVFLLMELNLLPALF